MAGFVSGKDEVNHVFSLTMPIKAVEIALSCPLGVTRFVLHENIFLGYNLS